MPKMSVVGALDSAGKAGVAAASLPRSMFRRAAYGSSARVVAAPERRERVVP